MAETRQMFSQLDVDRILRRAAEIEGSESAKHLSMDELKVIAAEAGFGRQAVERALAEAADAATASTARRTPVQKWGLVKTHLSTLRELPVQIDSDAMMRMVRLFHPYREGPAQVQLDEGRISWQDRKGLRFSVTSAGGITEIRVYVSRFLLRRGRWMGWVSAAADRLEMLAWLVAERDRATPGKALSHLSQG
ncbi:MAG: hypothetical protein PVJ02_09610 [Gemmatimonadota bacterium]|jgi:hypothetical protein